VVGGCSSINGMIYMRGQARDYDGWAEITGEPDWAWERVVPDFMAHEDHWRMEGDPDPAFAALHGRGGEWRVERQRLKWDILEAFVEACVAAGIPRTEDFNAGTNEGVGYFEVNQRAGLRWNTSRPSCGRRGGGRTSCSGPRRRCRGWRSPRGTTGSRRAGWWCGAGARARR
jgi:choline dehydrogenase